MQPPHSPATGHPPDRFELGVTPAASGRPWQAELRAFDSDGNVVTSAVTMIRVRIPGAPTVAFSVKPTAVDEGGSVQLGAAATSSDGSAIVRVEGLRDGTKTGEDTAARYSRTVTFLPGGVGDFSFRARAVNANGFARLSAPVVVAVTAKNKPVINAASATPAILPAAGPTKLSWSTTGAEQLLLRPGNIDVTGTTSRTVDVTASTLFTLTAVKPAGAVTKNASVRVIPPPPIQSFTATPSTTAAGGGTVTLAWSATDASSASIDNGVGSVTGLTSKVVDVTTIARLPGESAGIYFGTGSPVVLMSGGSLTENHRGLYGPFTNTGSITLAGAQVTSNRHAGLEMIGGGTVTISGSDAAQAIALEGSAASSFDLGSSTGAGNTIAGNAGTGLELQANPAVTVRASCNAWNAGTQGTDASGLCQLGSAPCGATGPCVVTSGRGSNDRIVTGSLELLD